MAFEQTTLSVDLSHDELAWLLYTLRLPPLIGMGSSLYPEGTSEAVANARLEAGALALQARQLVSAGEDRVEIESVLLGMLGAYAMAESMLIVNLHRLDDAAAFTRAYYLSPDLTVAYDVVAPRLYRLTGMAEDAVFLDEVLQTLDVGDGVASQFPPQTIAPARLEAVSESVRAGDRDAALHLLLEGGWDAGAGEQLVRALETQNWTASVIVLRSIGEGEDSQMSTENSLALIGFDTGVLGFITSGADDGRVTTVSAFSEQTIRAHLQEALALKV